MCVQNAIFFLSLKLTYTRKVKQNFKPVFLMLEAQDLQDFS